MNNSDLDRELINDRLHTCQFCKTDTRITGLKLKKCTSNIEPDDNVFVCNNCGKPCV